MNDLMQSISKYKSTMQSLFYSKLYRAPKWFLKKAFFFHLDKKKEYRLKMRMGHQVILRPTQNYLQNIIYSGQYNDDLIFFAAPFIHDNSIILDIGANIGLYSCAYAQYFNKKQGLNIYAIEAVTNNFNLLNKNIALNNFSKIKSFNLALGKEEGELSLSLADENFVGNAVGSNVFKNFDHENVITKVPMITLDKFAEENKILTCDYIKLDVEGAEYYILEGGKKFISATRPVIQAEYNKFWLENIKITFKDFASYFSKLNDYTCAIEDKNNFLILTDPLNYEIEKSLTEMVFIPNEKISLL